MVESWNPNAKIATVKQTTNYYLPSLQSNETYYWTVVAYDHGGAGRCICGTWNFRIEEDIINHPPITLLNNPENDNIVDKYTVSLSWNGSDQDNDDITYSVYFGENYNSILKLDKNFKIDQVTSTFIEIKNLTNGKKYYWTIIPDDGRNPGVCLDKVWAFEVDTEKNPKIGKDSDLSLNQRIIQFSAIIIILILILITLAWKLQRSRIEKRIEQYLHADPKAQIPSSVKSNIFSSKTLRALHSGDTEGESLEDVLLDISKAHISTLKGDTSIHGSLVVQDDYSQPYINGEYSPAVAKPSYHLKPRYAAHVRHAIPYATGEKKQTHISSKSKIELAKPLSKKIVTNKALKASSLPITRECPNCGSFKVKTFKDDTSKCLDCKFKF
jgi:hypothetical protein